MSEWLDLRGPRIRWQTGPRNQNRWKERKWKGKLQPVQLLLAQKSRHVTFISTWPDETAQPLSNCSELLGTLSRLRALARTLQSSKFNYGSGRTFSSSSFLKHLKNRICGAMEKQIMLYVYQLVDSQTWFDGIPLFTSPPAAAYTMELSSTNMTPTLFPGATQTVAPCLSSDKACDVQKPFALFLWPTRWPATPFFFRFGCGPTFPIRTSVVHVTNTTAWFPL